jgi:hypothetical protein
MNDKSILLAKLTVALDETKQRIYSEILPMCQYIAPEELAEVMQSLELAASSIEQHQKQFRIQSLEAR